MKVSVLVDGFNLYHSIKDASGDGCGGDELLWLDLWELSKSFLHQLSIPGEKELESVHYFSAWAHHKTTEDPQHVKRHEAYVRCLEDSGVNCHMHRFKQRRRTCKECDEQVRFHEEKETDVAMAIMLLEVLMREEADIVILVTGDTDLAPAVRCAHRMFPSALIWFAFPHRRKNTELVKLVKSRGGSIKIKGSTYRKFPLPDPYITKRRKEVFMPEKWRLAPAAKE